MARSAVSAILVALIGLAATADAVSPDAAVKAMDEHLEFVDYGGGTMLPEQIPSEKWRKFHVIDARDKDQFAREHIPGAVNIEWRQVLAQWASLAKDKPILNYCNQGTLSAHAGFALRVAGFDNVRVLEGGCAERMTKGGFEAAARAAAGVAATR